MATTLPRGAAPDALAGTLAAGLVVAEDAAAAGAVGAGAAAYAGATIATIAATTNWANRDCGATERAQAGAGRLKTGHSQRNAKTLGVGNMQEIPRNLRSADIDTSLKSDGGPTKRGSAYR
jgi:hypothetical protein